MAYVLADAEIDFVVVEDQEQVDKIFEIKQAQLRISRIIVDDERGLRNYHQPELSSFAKVVEIDIQGIFSIIQKPYHLLLYVPYSDRVKTVESTNPMIFVHNVVTSA